MKHRNLKPSKGQSRTLPGDGHHAGYHESSQSMLSSYIKPTGAQLAQMAAILDGEEEDQFDELDFALEKAVSRNDQDICRGNQLLCLRGRCQWCNAPLILSSSSS